MLNGELTTDEAAEELMQLTPAKAHYDYDGLYYAGEPDNTISAMLALGMTDRMDNQIDQRIEKLIDTVIEKEETEQ